MDHRPSVLAAAAVLAACDDHMTNKMVEMKINAVPSWGPAEKVNFLLLFDGVIFVNFHRWIELLIVLCSFSNRSTHFSVTVC